jgi:hypothetical protein
MDRGGVMRGAAAVIALLMMGEVRAQAAAISILSNDANQPAVVLVDGDLEPG